MSKIIKKTRNLKKISRYYSIKFIDFIDSKRELYFILLSGLNFIVLIRFLSSYELGLLITIGTLYLSSWIISYELKKIYNYNHKELNYNG